MPLTSLFLSPQGRIGRLTFWLGMIGYKLLASLMLAAGSVLVRSIAGVGHPMSWSGWWLVSILSVASWPLMALTIKRFHDLDMSGFWSGLALFQLLFIFALAAAAGAGQAGHQQAGGWAMLVMVAAVLGTIWNIWLLIKLAFFSGSTGPNRFGPPPRALLFHLLRDPDEDGLATWGEAVAVVGIPRTSNRADGGHARSQPLRGRAGGPVAFGRRSA